MQIIKTFCEDIDKNTVRLLMKDHPDKIVKIDKEDYDRIKYYACYIEKNNYVAICVPETKALHRVLMNETNPKIFVDHINSNPLDNTKIKVKVKLGK